MHCVAEVAETFGAPTPKHESLDELRCGLKLGASSQHAN